MYSSTLPSTSALEGVGGQRHAPTGLPPRKTTYTLYRRRVAAKARLDWCGKPRPYRGSTPGLSSKKLVFVLEILSKIWYYDGYIYIYIYIYIYLYIPTFQRSLPQHYLWWYSYGSSSLSRTNIKYVTDHTVPHYGIIYRFTRENFKSPNRVWLYNAKLNFFLILCIPSSCM
jgi:hypothetical protein